MRLVAGVLRARQQGTQEYGLEFTAVVGEVRIRLAEAGTICGISRRNAPFASLNVAPWLCQSRSLPSVVRAQI